MLATPAGRRRALLYGWAWLFAVGELLVGGEARRLETSLDYERDTALGRNATSVLGVAVLGNGTAALQGGGAHGAVTWGVADRLLEDERIDIAAISGTSAGAVNAAAVAYGLHKGGCAGARKRGSGGRGRGRTMRAAAAGQEP